MIEFTLLDKRYTHEALGLIPEFLSRHSPKSAKEQLHENYAHGGGWNKMEGWTLIGDKLSYPGDPTLYPIAKAELRNETILIYPSAWVVIRQPDRSFEIARMD